MTYQDYFRNSKFEDIWTILKEVYLEPDELKASYNALYETIKTMPILPEYSEETIKMVLDSDYNIKVEDAPDPQEWLVGREVEIDFDDWKDDPNQMIKHPGKEQRQMARESPTSTLAAHLLYWSTLYAIKTQRKHQEEFSAWLKSLNEESADSEAEEIEVEPISIGQSFTRKQEKYWRETVRGDSAISWSWNFKILKKKIEYNIGYWRYVQRYVGWENDVRRMKTASYLLATVAYGYPQIKGKYINTRNAKRFTKARDENPELHDLYLKHLYIDKAYSILWRWLDHNMKRWWD